MLHYALSDEDLEAWKENQFLVLKTPWGRDEVDELKSWVDTLASWPETPGKWMKYFETPPGSSSKQLCRVENFIQYHDPLNQLLNCAGVMNILEKLMGEPAVLFKEKVNFKLPGGAGFSAHQDAPAFVSFGHRYHITMLISVDDSNAENGCLEMSAPIPIYETLPQAEDGTIDREREAQMSWTPLPTQAGDIVFFDSYIPHRSQSNQSQSPRRALYVTYNRASDGRVRDDYYAHKRSVFPPDCERVPGVDYSKTAGPYNLGNPIR